MIERLSPSSHICGYGVIGSHATLRMLCRKAWGFESLYPHKIGGPKSSYFVLNDADKGTNTLTADKSLLKIESVHQGSNTHNSHCR